MLCLFCLKMSRKRGTMKREPCALLFLRGETRAIRQFSLSSRMARAGVAILGVVGVLFVAATVFLVFATGERVSAALLARENRLLEDELRRAEGQLAAFNREITALAERDERIRLLAGMNPIDEEIFEVGVGGPGLESPEEGELWDLDPEASETVYAIRYDLQVLERKANLLSESFEEVMGFIETQKDRLAATPLILPAGGLLSSRFSRGRFHPVLHRFMAHEGIDVHAPLGTPILAAAHGLVAFAGWKAGYGNTVIIDHGHGFKTLYGHSSELLVAVGKRVRRGEVIARVGSTGRSTAPHLHYEIHVDGRPVNPLDYILGDAIP